MISNSSRLREIKISFIITCFVIFVLRYNALGQFSTFLDAPTRRGGQPVHSGTFEGVIVNPDKVKEDEVEIVFLFTKLPIVFYDQFNEDANTLIIDFYDIKIGESEIDSVYEFPIRGFQIEDVQIDLNKKVAGFRPDIRHKVQVKLSMSNKVEYMIEENFGVISLSIHTGEPIIEHQWSSLKSLKKKARINGPFQGKLNHQYLLNALSQKKRSSKQHEISKNTDEIFRAMKFANPGDTILIQNGIYKVETPIRMAEGVILTGASPNKKPVLLGNGKHPIIIASEGAIINNLVIKRGTVGILSTNVKSVIMNNSIELNKKAGIHCFLKLPHIINNVIKRNKLAGIYLENVKSTDTYIEHNVVTKNSYSGIYLAGNTEVLTQNNIFCRNKGYSIFSERGSIGSLIRANNFYNPLFSIYKYVNKYANLDVDLENTFIKPEFLSPKKGIYWLVDNSPLIRNKTVELKSGLTSWSQFINRKTNRNTNHILIQPDECLNAYHAKKCGKTLAIQKKIK